MKHLIIGGICGFACAFLVTCFVMWSFPPDFSDISIYGRAAAIFFLLWCIAAGAILSNMVRPFMEGNKNDS